MESIFSSFTEPAAAMATTEPLIFVIATAAQLPQASTCLEVLQEAQATGPSTGFVLRIFSKGAKHSDLGQLPVDGLLTGEQRRSSDGTQLLCDALGVQIEHQHELSAFDLRFVLGRLARVDRHVAAIWGNNLDFDPCPSIS